MGLSRPSGRLPSGGPSVWSERERERERVPVLRKSAPPRARGSPPQALGKKDRVPVRQEEHVTPMKGEVEPPKPIGPIAKHNSYAGKPRQSLSLL